MITTKATIPNIFEYKTNLAITGSFGYEFTQEIPIGKNVCVGATVQAFQVTDTRDGRAEWFDFLAVGTGGSLGAAALGSLGIGGGPSSLPSKGSRLYGGVLNLGAAELDELNNKPGTIISGSVSPAGALATSLTVVIFNPVPQFPFPAPLAWHTIGGVAGLNLSTSAGAGLMQYYGIFTKSGFGKAFG